jgi:hypothetical protein
MADTGWIRLIDCGVGEIGPPPGNLVARDQVVANAVIRVGITAQQAEHDVRFAAAAELDQPLPNPAPALVHPAGGGRDRSAIAIDSKLWTT